MTFALNRQLKPAWPPLAWLAKCVSGSPTAHLSHGSMVEVQESSFCEAVWDAPFEGGGFDRTDIIFGSAGVAREGSFVFVSSGSTVDRLQSISVNGVTWVSNSLPCLLSAVDGSVDVTYDNYYDDFESIIHGLNHYKRTLETSVGRVRLTYFNNLKWDGHELVELPKPAPARDLGTFAEYRRFLESTIEKIAANASSAGRTFPYRLLATLSSGYDSPAVAVLARKAGLHEAISFANSRGGYADDGREIGKTLGINVTLISRDAWRAGALAEVPFIAADAKGEDIHFGGAAKELAGCVLLTAFNGGRVWNRDPRPKDSDIVRGDQSGLALTDYRLSAGFVHVPVPFFGARHAQEIHAIGHHAEMAPFDIGGNYNRPIPRRIIEEAGIPRGRFAVSKKAASMLFFERESFLSPDSLRDFTDWLTRHSHEWSTRRKVPPFAAASLFNMSKPLLAFASIGARCLIAVAPPTQKWKVQRLHGRLKEAQREEYLFRYVFPWAMEKAKSRY